MNAPTAGAPVTFTVLGVPRGKGRARSVIRPGKGGTKYVAHVTPEATTQYEGIIAVEAQRAMAGRIPLAVPVKIEVWAIFEIPKSASKVLRQNMLDHKVMPAKKPDLDNIVKAVKDAINHVVYHDDSLVCDLISTKRYGERPRVVIRVTPLQG